MKLNKLFGGLLGLGLALSLVACQTEIGPAGPAGPAGPQGPAGNDGQNGAENCVDCHGSNQLITAKMFQWENSVHATGGHYDRNATSCAICHTSQGFLEVAGTGATATAATIDNPLPQNCYTCHQIHNTYTDADWALSTESPVTFWVGGETRDIGKGNLCINCHQARARTPALPDPNTTGTISLTSSHWGPHYGAQGTMFTGAGAYETVGSTPYANSAHTTMVGNACIGCHMAPVTGGRAAGGHTFRVESVDGDLNTNGCVQCHTDAGELETLVEATQLEIEDLLFELGEKLYAKGIFNASHGLVVPVDVSHDEAGAVWNFFFVEEDKSYGVHNAKYTRALLKNSIEALQ